MGQTVNLLTYVFGGSNPSSPTRFTNEINCGSSSVDRALAFQAKGREFEPRLPLKIYERVPFLGTLFLCILENSDNFASL